MKVIQTPPRYFPYIGGVERVSQELAVGLMAVGHDVEVVCAGVPDAAAAVVDGVPVRRLKPIGNIANTPITPLLPIVLLRADFDVIHTHLPTPWSADWSVMVGWLRRRRTVLTYYNVIPGKGLEGWIARIYRATAEVLSMRLADVILLQSETWRERLTTQRPWLANKLVVIPNGVDVERYSPGNGERARRQLLFVSKLDRFHEYKGLNHIIEAMVTCDADLFVVGEGELRARYEEQARRLGIAQRVRFCGAVGNEDLVDLYRSSAAFVLGSDGGQQEGGSSLVVLEAMSCGLPAVVARGVGDISVEVENVGAGLSVPDRDPEALAAALMKLLDDEDERSACSARARAHVVENYAWPVIVERVLSAYVDGG